MTIDIPTPNQLREVADQIGLTLSDDDVISFRSLMEGSIGALNAVDAMPDELPSIKYPRDGGTWPTAEENPLNGWYVRTSIKGASDGKLKGKKVAELKELCKAAGKSVDGKKADLIARILE